jgi:YesN/AraC family two-component response regulator
VYEEATKNACLNFGAKAYLKKPISKKQVEEALAA